MSASGPADATMPRSPGELILPTTWLRIAVVSALVLMVYWGPIRYTLIERWINDGNWSHGWLIPAFSCYFLWMHRKRLFSATIRPSYLGALVMVISLALYFASAWWFRMSYPQAVSIVGVILGATLLLGGWGLTKVAWFPILFLLLAVPLPQQTYVQVTQPMRAFASSGAALIMPVFAPGLYTEAQAVVIDYIVPGGARGQLNVEEACSGMRLMMAFVTLGVAMAYLGERPAWQRLVMVIACVPIAIFCNTLRVTATGLFFVYGHEDLARGTPHQLLGFVMLAVALGLFSLLGYVLSHLFIEEAQGSAADSAAEPS
ncbi:MAG: exosortase/archaeosortase family protein [Phycisphaerales bacterium]|nr:MAG: exosortase/archaeosortase family protein [Phycisphaerales bacterium]